MKTDFVKLLVVTVALCAVVLSCSHPSIVSRESVASQDKLVVTADGGYSLSERHVFEMLDKTLLLPQGGLLSDTTVQMFRDSMVVDSLTGLEAWKLSIAKYPIEYRDYQFQCKNNLSSTFYQHAVMDMVKVDSQAVLEFYEQHKSRFVVGEQVEISHILISPTYLMRGPDSTKYSAMSADQVEKIAAAEADSVYELLTTGASFKKVAEQFSHDQLSKTTGGYLGWAIKGQYPAPFDSVAFLLKPGEFSHPYRDPDGFHIISVSDRLPEGPVPIDRPDFFKEVSTLANQTAEQERAAVVLDSLIRGLKVDLNPGVVDSTILTCPDSIWFAVVNGMDTISVLEASNYVDIYMHRHIPPLRVLGDDQRKQAIEKLIQRALYMEGARAARMDTLPDYLAEIGHARFAVARGILVRGWYGPDWAPTDSQIAEYYRTHLSDYQTAKPLTVQQIVAKDSVTAQFIRVQAAAGMDFLDLAQQFYAADSTQRRKLADVGKIGPEDVDSTFYRAAIVTAAGDISAVVKTASGYRVIKVLARNDSRSLPEAKLEIAETLSKIHRREQFAVTRERLFAEYHVKFPNKIGPVFLEPVSYRLKKK